MSDWQVMLTDYELSDDDVGSVLETLRSGWLTMGPRTQELESAFAVETGAAHAVAVSSASAALHLACIAAGFGPGDEVIVPGLGFAVDAHAPRLTGAEPALVDVESPARPLLSVEAIEAHVGERTRGVILVHMFGYAADAAAIAGLCADRDLILIEDCAQAAGAALAGGASVGTAGAAGCFSFYSKTALGVGEGGILITDDEALAERVRLLRSHAMTSVTWDRHRGHAETYDVVDLGFNYRLDEPRATLALSRLARLGETVGELRAHALEYRRLLAGVAGVELPFDTDDVAGGGHFAFPVLVADRERRDSVREAMRARGVQTTAYPALTQFSEYSDRDACPVAEQAADRHLALPIYAGLSADQAEIVVGELRAALLQ